MLQNHVWEKDPLELQDRPMTFNATVQKFIVFSNSTLQLTFKKLLPLKKTTCQVLL